MARSRAWLWAAPRLSQWSGASELAALTSPTGLALGTPFALLRVPQLGRSWQFAVVQGTGEAQLAPGHLPGTAPPGQVGNFVVAGHRVTAGGPFWRLPSLHVGSLVTLVTINARYVYEVTGATAVVTVTLRVTAWGTATATATGSTAAPRRW